MIVLHVSLYTFDVLQSLKCTENIVQILFEMWKCDKFQERGEYSLPGYWQASRTATESECSDDYVEESLEEISAKVQHFDDSNEDIEEVELDC